METINLETEGQSRDCRCVEGETQAQEFCSDKDKQRVATAKPKLVILILKLVILISEVCLKNDVTKHQTSTLSLRRTFFKLQIALPYVYDRKNRSDEVLTGKTASYFRRFRIPFATAGEAAGARARLSPLNSPIRERAKGRQLLVFVSFPWSQP
jgi:hypothetical protein